MNEDFLKNLAAHEEEKVKEEQDSRQRILMYAGARLNWMGDYMGNPDIEWREEELELDQIEFTGSDEFLIETCERSPKIFQEKALADHEIKSMYENLASYGNETILVRNSDHDFVKYKILDGTHRVIGAAMSGKKTIKAMVPLNEKDYLPVCEAHTVYDLIRGYLRNRRTDDGKIELYHSLKLLINSYANVHDLLENRFNKKYVNNDEVQLIIEKVLNNKPLD